MINLPTLSQLYTGILSDLQTQYGVSISPVGKSFLRALAAVQAGKLKLQYLALGNLQKNIFVDTADPENIGGTLERFGRVKINRNPKPAVAAQYSILLTGSIGAIVNGGTTFKSNDDSLNAGMLFILDNSHTMVTANDNVTVRALTTGTISKLNILDHLTSTSPIALINSDVYVVSQMVEPLDAENIEDYRLAIINSYRLPPQGGSPIDYRLWSADVQGVKQVYPYATNGQSNEIDLYVEAVIADSTDGKGTPSAAMLIAIEAVVEFNPDTTLPTLERGRRPIGLFQVNYLPVTIKTVDIVIAGFQGLTADIQAQLLSATISAISAIRPFVSGADILAEKNDILDTNKTIGIIITSQPGAVFTSITIKINSIALSTYTFSLGNIPYLNSVTYV